MEPEPISTAYFINPSHQPVCLYVYPPIVARQGLGKCIPPFVAKQRLGKHVPRQRINASIEELEACVCGSVSVSPYRCR
jgi:hypothetical protein